MEQQEVRIGQLLKGDFYRRGEATGEGPFTPRRRAAVCHSQSREKGRTAPGTDLLVEPGCYAQNGMFKLFHLILGMEEIVYRMVHVVGIYILP